MKTILMVIIITIVSLGGCKSSGLTKSETETVFRIWNKRTEDLEQAIAKGMFSKAYIKSMKERDKEGTELLEEGLKDD